jgi:hypothetical protein
MFLRSQIILDIFIWMPLPMLKVSKQNAVHCKSKLLSLFLKIIFRTFSNRCFKCFSFSLPFIHCLSAYPIEHLELHTTHNHLLTVLMRHWNQSKFWPLQKAHTGIKWTIKTFITNNTTEYRSVIELTMWAD